MTKPDTKWLNTVQNIPGMLLLAWYLEFQIFQSVNWGILRYLAKLLICSVHNIPGWLLIY